MNRIILFLIVLALASTGCVSVAVQSTNRDMSAYGKEVKKIMLVAKTDLEFNDYFKNVLARLSADLKERGIETTTFLFSNAAAGDMEFLYREKLKAFEPCHILTIQKMTLIESQDEIHMDEDAKLDLQLNLSGQENFLWRSTLAVNSGGVMGFGTIGTGNGGKLTAQKIIDQLVKEKIIK